jgi:acyl-CoA thioesterase
MSRDHKEVLNAMLAKDYFSQWLGLTVDEHTHGYCRLHFTITRDMLNGFGIVHGGVVFSAADSAFAFACNADNVLTVALDVHISFIKAANEGDVLTVTAKQLSAGNRVAFYDIMIYNSQNEIVANFKGTAYRTGRAVVPISSNDVA